MLCGKAQTDNHDSVRSTAENVTVFGITPAARPNAM